MVTCIKMKIQLYLHIVHNIQSKWNAILSTYILLAQTIRRKYCCITASHIMPFFPHGYILLEKCFALWFCKYIIHTYRNKSIFYFNIYQYIHTKLQHISWNTNLVTYIKVKIQLCLCTINNIQSKQNTILSTYTLLAQTMQSIAALLLII